MDLVNLQDEGYECESQYNEFLNSEDGQELEKMYELTYGLDSNNIHNN